MNNVEDALIGSSNSEYPLLFTSEKNGVARFASLTSEEIIQINFCGAYYLTVLLFTSVSVASVDIYLVVERLGKYPSLLYGKIVFR